MTQCTMLIVDDEVAIRDMLRMALELAGYRCLEAENIHDAYRLVVDERPGFSWGGAGKYGTHRV